MTKAVSTRGMPKLAAGHKFGRLTAIEFVDLNKHRGQKWRFLCDCGGSKVTAAYSVRSGVTKSCGCLAINKAHGRGGRRPHENLVHARANSASQYFTGLPCHNGHVANRWTASQDCIECERLRPHAKNRLARGYGFHTWQDVEDIKSRQKDRCGICERLLENSRNTHIDHCHKTSIVRGILCRNCNQGLGHFFDKPELLRAAAEYLECSPEAPQTLPSGDQPCA